MKFYLSSYKFGGDVDRLVGAAPYGKIGYIPNALDFTGADLDRKVRHELDEIATLKSFGLDVELLDLTSYFGRQDELDGVLDALGAIFICGGNVFVLRQAMKLSGLDQLLANRLGDVAFLYSGYSAGACVLAPDLSPYAIVDDATDTPYEGLDDVIMEGLGFVDYALMPHWDSDHPETTLIDKGIAFCKANNVPFKALRDGEVIFMDGAVQK